jgi:hypothetical protein
MTFASGYTYLAESCYCPQYGYPRSRSVTPVLHSFLGVSQPKLAPHLTSLSPSRIAYPIYAGSAPTPLTISLSAGLLPKGDLPECSFICSVLLLRRVSVSCPFLDSSCLFRSLLHLVSALVLSLFDVLLAAEKGFARNYLRGR